MGFYDSPQNVEQYVEMAKGYDGRSLIERMRRYLEPVLSAENTPHRKRLKFVIYCHSSFSG
jgi:hypothetical protein